MNGEPTVSQLASGAQAAAVAAAQQHRRPALPDEQSGATATQTPQQPSAMTSQAQPGLTMPPMMQQPTSLSQMPPQVWYGERLRLCKNRYWKWYSLKWMHHGVNERVFALMNSKRCISSISQNAWLVSLNFLLLLSLLCVAFSHLCDHGKVWGAQCLERV